MTKKLKMFSMAALATVAAVTAQAAATPTNITVLNKVTVALTASMQGYKTNKAGTVITAGATNQSAFSTKTLLAAINAAGGPAVAATSSLAYTNSYVLTNGYVVVFTNAANGTLFTNLYTGTNYAGLTNASIPTQGLTINTNLVYSPKAGGWAIVTGTTITSVSNVEFFASGGGAGVSTGNDKALDGVPLQGKSGSYETASGYAELNTSSNTWSFYVSGYGGSASVTAMNLGTAKAPAYITTSDATVPVFGSGTDTTATSTNTFYLKGTMTDNFWKVLSE
jgi:hypothetical protein